MSIFSECFVCVAFCLVGLLMAWALFCVEHLLIHRFIVRRLTPSEKCRRLLKLKAQDRAEHWSKTLSLLPKVLTKLYIQKGLLFTVTMLRCYLLILVYVLKKAALPSGDWKKCIYLFIYSFVLYFNLKVTDMCWPKSMQLNKLKRLILLNCSFICRISFPSVCFLQ